MFGLRKNDKSNIKGNGIDDKSKKQTEVTEVSLVGLYLDSLSDDVLNGDDKKISVLHELAKSITDNNKESIVKEILKRGVDVNIRCKIHDFEGFSPLHFAVINNNLISAKIFIENGADVNALSDELDSPLHCAAFQGYLQMAKFLVAKGANINAKNDVGKTPLDYAIEERHENIIKYLKL